MKIKSVTAVLLCFLTLLLCGVTASADSLNVTYTAAQVQSLCDGILAYKENQSGSSGAQGLIDGYLSDNAGSISEFYIIGLSQYGSYSFTSYESSLLSYLDSHEVYSASTREKYALALIASGSTDSYITKTADEAIGGLGLMSFVFGLHILNNGYPSAMYSVDGLISDILSYQLSDGGWAVMGSNGDIDVTAMTLQALAPHYGSRSDVNGAVDRAVQMLSDKQKDSGGFASMGSENCESAAQVVAALSALEIDAQYDGRFVKNGNSALSAMLSYRNSDGSFAHTGTGFNESATVQAFYSMVAFLRYCRGQSSLYVLDNANHSAPSGDSGGNGSSSGNQGSGGSGGSGNNTAAGNSSGGSGSPNASVGAASQSGTSADSGSVRNNTSTAAASGEKVTAATEKAKPTTAAQAENIKPTYGGFQPSATADMKAASYDESKPGRGGYKIYAILGVIAAAGIACLILFLLKKRNKKNYIAVAVIAAAGIIFVLITNFESAESYSDKPVTEGDFTVTMSISCETISGMEKVNDYIPDDGVILDTTEFSVSEGDTVFDVLMLAPKMYGIAVDNRGAQGAAYIAGINFLYEFAYGDLSGWMYRVNGEFPEVGCQSYYLHDGDKIEWLYTTNIGKDL